MRNTAQRQAWRHHLLRPRRLAGLCVCMVMCLGFGVVAHETEHSVRHGVTNACMSEQLCVDARCCGRAPCWPLCPLQVPYPLAFALYQDPGRLACKLQSGPWRLCQQCRCKQACTATASVIAGACVTQATMSQGHRAAGVDGSPQPCAVSLNTQQRAPACSASASRHVQRR